jgi:hypothetical protein
MFLSTFLLAAAIAAAFLTEHLMLGRIEWYGVLITIFATVKLMYLNTVSRTANASQWKTVLGMPVITFGFYVFILALIMFFVAVHEPKLLPQTNLRFKVFGLCALWGWLASGMEWYFTPRKVA